MTSPLQSLIATGTKLWLDSIDPELVASSRALGATGATSNPIIVANLLKSGRFDDEIRLRFEQGLDDDQVAWQMTDYLVRLAQDVFLPIWQQTGGNDGYVSFELDPLLEDLELGPPHAERVARYIALGKQWSEGHDNRMIKVPATPAGLESVEELAAAGVTLNVTLVFSPRQYEAARDAVWRGVQRSGREDSLKSVYSIFVSRVDVYTEQHVSELSEAAQGLAGIINAKRLWADNHAFWAERNMRLDQEIIFASTGTKRPQDPAWKYIGALAGSDIQTNPPATNAMIEQSGQSFTRQVDQLPAEEVLSEIDRLVDIQELESTLMKEGIQKFADPQKSLLQLIADKRSEAISA
jgi:transaldolase